MADIIDEVIRDKREEVKLIYFKKALPFVLGATILVVLAMIISDFRKTNAKEHNMEMGDTIINSLENLANDPNVAMEGLDYVKENAKNHSKDIAALQQIAINVASNNDSQAIEMLEQVINNKKYLDLTRSYAKITWISIMMDKKSISDDIKSKMEKYFADFSEKSPFYSSAKLLEALYYVSTDTEKAKNIASSLLSSKVATQTIKEEAAALISNLNIGK